MKKKFIPFINRKFVSTFGASGDFDASTHLEYLLKAEEDWADGKYQDELVAHVDVGVQQLTNQTARFSQLDNPAKDNTVNLTWIKTGAIVAEDFVREDDSCTIDPAQMETDSQPYEMDLLYKSGFKIDLESLRTNIYTEPELVAKGLLKADKQLSERWCKQLITAYKAFVGANIPAVRGLTAPFTWDNGNLTTNIPAASFGIGIVANLIKQMQLNMVSNGMFINDGTLFEAWTNAMLNAGNLDGKGDDLRLKQINMKFDMWNFDAAGVTENMFLVDKSAVAMKTFCRFGSTPEYVAGTIQQTRYKIKSKFLPGVEWDVRFMMKCVDGVDFKMWQLESQGGIWLNPTPIATTINAVDYTSTGVYSYTKTA